MASRHTGCLPDFPIAPTHMVPCSSLTTICASRNSQRRASAHLGALLEVGGAAAHGASWHTPVQKRCDFAGQDANHASWRRRRHGCFQQAVRIGKVTLNCPIDSGRHPWLAASCCSLPTCNKLLNCGCREIEAAPAVHQSDGKQGEG